MNFNPIGDFTLPIIPPTATAQQKGIFIRNGRAHFFTKKKVRAADNLIGQFLIAHIPKEPIATPAFVSIHWQFPYRKSERKSVVNSRRPIPHISRPDLDNLEKQLLDLMTRMRFWIDDSLIASKNTLKTWGEKPFLRICYGTVE